MGSNVSASTAPRAVIRVTDIQGDGIPDAIIGMPELGYNTGESGLVSIHLGTATGIEAVPTQVLGGYTADSKFGSALAIDDFNDDGMVDLAIGAYYDNVVKIKAQTAGRDRVYFMGRPRGCDKKTLIIECTQARVLDLLVVSAPFDL